MAKLLLSLLVVSFSIAYGQNQKLYPTLQDSFSFKADTYVGFDQFRFLYYITEDGLYKTKDNETFEYKNPTLGKITKVDLQNPLKVV